MSKQIPIIYGNMSARGGNIWFTRTREMNISKKVKNLIQIKVKVKNSSVRELLCLKLFNTKNQ
jgi:hypothetical protein